MSFPTLFNLAIHKDARVAEVWDSSREEGGWSLIFSRPLNDWEVEEVERFLQALHGRKYRPLQEDKLVLKTSKADSFFVKFIFSGLVNPPLWFSLPALFGA